MFMADKKYDLLEDRVKQLEDIIDNMITDIRHEDSCEYEHITTIPSEIVEEIEKSIKDPINVVGIT